MTAFGRVLRTGLSSLRDRAAARLAGSRINPSRKPIVERAMILLSLMDPQERLVAVKTWRPYWDGRHLTWPTLLIDKLAGHRCTSSPVWDRHRFRAIGRVWKAHWKA